jgi:hypothetical protein
VTIGSVTLQGPNTISDGELLANPESGREVIGQNIEYAANANAAWEGDQLRIQSATTRKAGSLMKAPGGGYCQNPANLNCSWRFSSRS